MLLVDVIDSATHGGMYACNVDVGAASVLMLQVTLVVTSELHSIVCTC